MLQRTVNPSKEKEVDTTKYVRVRLRPVRKTETPREDDMTHKVHSEAGNKSTLFDRQMDEQVPGGEVYNTFNRKKKTKFASIENVQYHRDLSIKTVRHRAPKRENKDSTETRHVRIHVTTHNDDFRAQGTPQGEVLITHKTHQQDYGRETLG